MGKVDFRLRQDFLADGSTRSFTPAKWQDGTAPKLDWLVDGCFLHRSVALISGDGGLGKSLLMQQLCTAAALGRDWLGIGTKRVKTYALFCEDDEDEIQRRQEAINRHYGCAMGDLEDVNYRCRPGFYNVLAEFRGSKLEPEPTPLFYALWNTCRDGGAQLIVLDTASDVFGGNEIAKAEVRSFITLLRRMALDLDACVILTAHVSNEGLATKSGLSGSRAWSNSVRSRLWLTSRGEDKDNHRFLKTMKNNHGPSGGKIPLQWQNGVFVRTDPPAKNWTEPEPLWR